MVNSKPRVSWVVLLLAISACAGGPPSYRVVLRNDTPEPIVASVEFGEYSSPSWWLAPGSEGTESGIDVPVPRRVTVSLSPSRTIGGTRTVVVEVPELDRKVFNPRRDGLVFVVTPQEIQLRVLVYTNERGKTRELTPK